MGKIHRWGLIVAFIVIILCAYMAVKIVFVEDKSATVPPLVGLQLVEAVEALQKEGLLAKIDQVDSPLKADTVVSQNMPAGEKIGKGKVVILRVSKGGALLPLPDVRGLKYEEAVSRLSEAGFKVNNVQRVTDSLKPVGTVIAQNPAAPQQVAASTMISLLVSSGVTGGTGFIVVPDVRGQEIGVVKEALLQSGLVVGKVTETPTQASPAGTVLSTNPKNGARIPSGSQVNITVARAPKPGELASDTPPSSPSEPTRTEPVRTVVVQPDPSQPQTPEYTPVSGETQPAATQGQAGQQQQQEPVDNTPSKTAKVRYQVPPLSRPMSLKIAITDGGTTRILRESDAKSNEYVSMNVPYKYDATITIYLGGELVWQDRFN
ncbi:PASTA domain-containing protein [Synergistaceae bacterium OttesenSCG-928-D05]|nr:PASTA domain-containing protein [Synergistaceae bacterium OttesenSCG-928-D05]